MEENAVVEGKKKVRRVTPKVEVTAIQILEGLVKLEEEVAELEVAIQGIATDNAAYPIVEKALNTKREEHEAAKNKVYFC